MYIDAGTGSMLLQVIAATFFTVLFFFRNILSLVKGKPQKAIQESQKTKLPHQ
ncbi:MAG: hypothetical protein IKP00_08275 [Victivallales bacterium]|nr:hypothetical protein [Victivallales bacterium]